MIRVSNYRYWKNVTRENWLKSRKSSKEVQQNVNGMPVLLLDPHQSNWTNNVLISLLCFHCYLIFGDCFYA